jgi:hypothetical protein
MLAREVREHVTRLITIRLRLSFGWGIALGQLK